MSDPQCDRTTVDAWLEQTLKPVSCAAARIAYVPPWHAGIGSALAVYACYAMLAVEHGYTVVPVRTWRFARGLTPPSHEHYFEPLSSCTAEADRRLAGGNVSKAEFIRPSKRPGSTRGNGSSPGESFVRLLRCALPDQNSTCISEARLSCAHAAGRERSRCCSRGTASFTGRSSFPLTLRACRGRLHSLGSINCPSPRSLLCYSDA